ncbi:MAG: DUF1801 domain-containing protein [Blastococcus sp.]
MTELDHPLEDGVEQLRTAILECNPGITEHIKWKAPSFRYAGEDRVTFQLRRADRIQLVLHRGVQVRADAASFTFDDPAGLLEWAAPDRAVVTFTDLADVEARTPALVDVVSRWVLA